MGVGPSRGREATRPFVSGEFTVAWLTFKGDSVEDTQHRYVAKKDGLVSSKLLRRLYGDDTIKALEQEEGEFISREEFICTLALCYEGNTEDRISYIFSMYSVIYGLEREGEGCILKKDYLYLLQHLEGINSVPKKLYAVFDECNIPDDRMLLNSQFVDWVRQYPLLMEFLAGYLPGSISPLSIRTNEDVIGPKDALNNSPSCRQDRENANGGGHFGSFDFIGGEDSGDDSDEAYDSDQISEMDEFGAFQSAPMTPMPDEVGDTSENSDSCETIDDVSPGLPPTFIDPLMPSDGRRQRKSRGVHKMGRNISRALGGGVSKVGSVGRTILHGGKAHPHTVDVFPGGDTTPAALLAAGYMFSSESQITKNYVCGYLHKISDGKWSKRSWHRRWFVLDRQQGVLSYYRYNPANHITPTSRGNIVHMGEEGRAVPPDSLPVNDAKDSKTVSSESARTAPGPRQQPVFTSPKSTPSAISSSPPQPMLYLNKSHPWFRGEIDLNIETVSLFFEKSLARNAPTRYFFQVSTLSLQEIESKRGMQYKLCAENEAEFDRWTLAIAEAINRKHIEQTVPRSAPALSHQQLYRQKLLQEEQDKKRQQLEQESEAASDRKRTPRDANSGTSPAIKSPPRQKNNDITASPDSRPQTAVTPTFGAAKDSPARTPPAKSTTPPRVVTHFPLLPPTPQWSLHLTIEGPKQCLIVGFVINLVTLKCLAAEHAIWKFLVCVAVTAAYIWLLRHPPASAAACRGSYGHRSASGDASFAHNDASVDSALLGTDVSNCADPERCCLHKPPPPMDLTMPQPPATERSMSGTAPPPPPLATPPAGGFKKYVLGSSMTRSEMLMSGKASKTPQSWSTTRAETFMVRGVDYKRSKRKEPSQAALFEFIGADLVRTESKVDLISQRVDLPEQHAADRLFIINAQLPSYAPSMWGGDSSCDGPGFTLALFWKVPPAVCEELEAPTSKAIRLLKRFLEAGNDTSLTDRFKVIAQVTNQDETGLSGMAKKLLVSHNSTPVLTRPQHRIYHFDNGSTEIVVDIHAFSYIARRGIHMLLDKTSKLVIDIAFVLQGENEDELPERILGCCRLDSVDVQKAMNLPR